MCGICGFTNFFNTLDDSENTIRRMCDIISHRGPDGEGFYSDGDVYLGHRRLSLQDISGGAQPMARNAYKESATFTPSNGEFVVENGRYTIVFNGEIYNFKDLKAELEESGWCFSTSCDTEVLLVSYIAWGKKCLEKFRGMFAFAIWDTLEKKLFCARDFFGIKPFYYAIVKGQFVFASEIKSILEYPFYEMGFNYNALMPYLSFQYSVLPETMFSGIYKLMPGHYLEYSEEESLQITRYWKPDYDIDEEMTIQQATQKISDAIYDSVSYHKISDVEVASFLSSGVDSNYLAASLSKQNANIKTFTVGFETEDGDKYNEISYAKAGADEMGVEHISHCIGEDEFWNALSDIQWHMDEPLADPAAAALYFVDREASKYVKAVLSGEGADELFCGYPFYQTACSNAKLDKIPQGLIKGAYKIFNAIGLRGTNYLYRASTPIEQRFIGNANIFQPGEYFNILSDYSMNHMDKTILERRPSDICAPFYKDVANLDEATKMQYIDLNLWMVGDILLKTDKMAMAHSLESRVPYLDKEVWKVARTLPHEVKINDNETKVSLRRAAETMLPEQFCKVKKLGFPVPIRVWLKQDKYYSLVKEAFSSETAEKFFNIENIVALLDEHKVGEKDNSRKIWTLYSFIIWYNRFFVE